MTQDNNNFDPKKRIAEVEANAKVFYDELLDKIIAEHRGEYAVMKDKKIVAYFTTFKDAVTAAEFKYEDGIFSIQKVTDMPINLGIHSYA